MVRHYLTLHLLVLIWGFTAILGMSIEIPSVEVVFYRTLIACVVLLGYILIRRKKLTPIFDRGGLFQLGTGVIIAAHWILFFLAARVSNVSVCLAGMATTSLWTAFLEPFYHRKRVQPFEVFLGFMALVGMVVIFNVAFDFWLGLLLAIISALLSAIFTIINAEFVKKERDPFVITFYEMLGAVVSIILFFPFYSSLRGGLVLEITWMDFLWLALLAVVCTVYAYSISVQLMKHISPFTMNLTVNLEPVYGIVLAVLIFGSREEMSAGFYVGTSLILMAVLAYPLFNKTFRRKPLPNRHASP